MLAKKGAGGDREVFFNQYRKEIPMSAQTLAPPPPAVCLTSSYVSRRIKGGTVIAQDVLDLEEHRKRLADPDDYRAVVGSCLRCDSERLHAHCFRERKLRPASPEEPPERVDVRLFRCATKSCGAVFTVLPAFIARHLWRAWETVEDVARRKLKAPATTATRWLARLESDASELLDIFMTSSSGPAVDERLSESRLQTREAFLEALKPLLRGLTSSFALTAAWIHRLEPGLRLM
jgi:hypothetical protein